MLFVSSAAFFQVILVICLQVIGDADIVQIFHGSRLVLATNIFQNRSSINKNDMHELFETVACKTATEGHSSGCLTMATMQYAVTIKNPSYDEGLSR